MSPRVDLVRVLGRTLLAFAFGLAMPIALFGGVLTLASGPRTVHELDVHRVEPADLPGSVRVLTALQLQALPPLVQQALDTAARAGAAKAVLDESAAFALAHMLGLAQAPSAWIQVHGALLHLEMHAWKEPTPVQALADRASGALGGLAQSARILARDLAAA